MEEHSTSDAENKATPAPELGALIGATTMSPQANVEVAGAWHDGSTPLTPFAKSTRHATGVRAAQTPRSAANPAGSAIPSTFEGETPDGNGTGLSDQRSPCSPTRLSLREPPRASRHALRKSVGSNPASPSTSSRTPDREPFDLLPFFSKVSGPVAQLVEHSAVNAAQRTPLLNSALSSAPPPRAHKHVEVAGSNPAGSAILTPFERANPPGAGVRAARTPLSAANPAGSAILTPFERANPPPRR